MQRVLRPAVVLAVALALGALLVAPLLAGGRIFALADGLLESYPSFVSPLRLWEPDMLLGYPVYADPSLATFYPLRALRFAPGGFDLYVLFGYALAAAAIFGYAFDVTRLASAGVVAALTFTLGGFMISQFGHPMIVQPTAWALVALWATQRHLSTRSVGRLAVVAASFALGCTAGQPQTTLWAVVLLGSYAAVVTFSPTRPLGSLAAAGSVLVAIALGLGIGSVAIVPAVALALDSARAGLTYAEFKVYALPLEHVARAIALPFAAGGGSASVYAHSPLESAAVPFMETSPYVAAAALALAVPGALTRPRRVACFWVAVALGGLALAVGEALPFAAWTYAVAPFNRFRVPGRHAFEFTLAVAVLAALGVASLDRLPRTRLRLAWGVVVGAAVVGMAAADVAIAARAAGPIPSVRTFLALDGCEALVVIAALAGPLPPRVRRALLVCAVALGGIGFAATSYARDVPTWASVAVPPAYASEVARLPLDPGQRVYTYGSDPASRLEPNLPQAWGLPDVAGYTPLQRPAIHAFLRSDFEGELLDPAARAVDRSAIRYVALAAEPPAMLPAAAPFSGIALRYVLSRQPGPRALTLARPFPVLADRIAVVSALGDARAVAQGTPVVAIDVADASGAVWRVVMRAGVETADVAYDAIAGRIAHARAPIFERAPIGTWYVAHIGMRRPTVVTSLTFRALTSAPVHLRNVSLVDDAAHRAYAMSDESAYADRTHYRALGTFDGVALFRNLRASPRAWSDAGPVVVRGVGPARRTYETACVRPCTLVSSDAWDAEWTATIDGAPTVLHAGPDVLEHVSVPAGRHVVTLAYRPRTLEFALLASCASLLALAAWLVLASRPARCR